jgi:hypothetical protein
MGENVGPFSESGAGSDDVKWVNVSGGAIQTHFTGPEPSLLFVDMPVSIGSTTCAVTLKLLSVDGGTAAFGLSYGGALGANNFAQIACKANNGHCQNLEPFGAAGSDVTIGAGIYLGIAFKGKRAFGFYDAGAGWTAIPGQPPQGTDVTPVADAAAYVYFAQRSGDAASRWDELDVVPLTSDLLP